MRGKTKLLIFIISAVAAIGIISMVSIIRSNLRLESVKADVLIEDPEIVEKEKDTEQKKQNNKRYITNTIPLYTDRTCTETLIQLYRNDKVKCLKEKNGIYKVKFNGKTGYVPSVYLSEKKLEDYVGIGQKSAVRKRLKFKPSYPVDDTKPMVALTFDDGPHNIHTNMILDALEKHGARATFFVLGNRVLEHADVIKRAASIGCEIGNHTFDHADLTKLQPEELEMQVDETDKLIQSVVSQNYIPLRPSYGNKNEEVLSAVKAPIVLWSLDTVDWKNKNDQLIAEHVMDQINDGDIVLMHDVYGETAKAALLIIEQLIHEGYQLVTVSELGYHKLGGLTTNVAYGRMK